MTMSVLPEAEWFFVESYITLMFFAGVQIGIITFSADAMAFLGWPQGFGLLVDSADVQIEATVFSTGAIAFLS